MTVFHAPEIVTKNLSFRQRGDRRLVTLSSNFLPLMGFEKGQALDVRPLGSLQGFEVARADASTTNRVYERRYTGRRSNNPFETQLEFASQSLIDSQFPAYTKRFHVEMRQGLVRFTPVANRAFAIRNRLLKANPFNAFVGLTGGVDVHALENLGFSVDIVMEWRPPEARDSKRASSLEEVHALNCAANAAPRVILNEDLYLLEMDRLEAILSDRPPIGLMVLSPQCDDMSPLKCNADKQRSVDDLSTTVDMVYPLLRQIETVQPGVVVIENVRGFANSASGILMTTTLRRMGYHVHAETMDARDFGGLQSRVRHHIVASIEPGFEFPKPQERNTAPIWSIIERHLGDCRDVTDTNWIRNRANSDRATRAITTESVDCPTLTKSQSRGIKDAVVIEHNGRFYVPSVGCIAELMSIPETFNASWMGVEQQVETMGQSVDYSMHHALLGAVRKHMEAAFGRHTVVRMKKNVTPVAQNAWQMGLF